MYKYEQKAIDRMTETYRLNEPMSWKEFKAMPDDIKRLYITILRQKFNVPDKHICRMMGQQSGGFSHEMQRLSIPSTRKCNVIWDKDGFYEWVNSNRLKQEETIQSCSGTICVVGNAKAVLGAIKGILGGESMKITITWEAV